MPICGKGCSWGGLRTAHCSACHETFSGVGPFDKHRSGGKCKSPDKAGLVRNEHGYWGSDAGR